MSLPVVNLLNGGLRNITECEMNNLANKEEFRLYDMNYQIIKMHRYVMISVLI